MFLHINKTYIYLFYCGGGGSCIFSSKPSSKKFEKSCITLSYILCSSTSGNSPDWNPNGALALWLLRLRTSKTSGWYEFSPGILGGDFAVTIWFTTGWVSSIPPLNFFLNLNILIYILNTYFYSSYIYI